MHPHVRLRWRPPHELSWHLWERMLVLVGQEEAQCSGRRWARTGVIRPVAAARAGLPSPGAVLPRAHPRRLDMRPPYHNFRFRHAAHRSQTPGTRGDFRSAGQTHLPPSRRDLGEMVHDKP